MHRILRLIETKPTINVRVNIEIQTQTKKMKKKGFSRFVSTA